jgi:hypothetical protein
MRFVAERQDRALYRDNACRSQAVPQLPFGQGVAKVDSRRDLARRTSVHRSNKKMGMHHAGTP